MHELRGSLGPGKGVGIAPHIEMGMEKELAAPEFMRALHVAALGMG